MAQTTANLVGSVLSSSRTGDLDIQVEDNPSQNPDHDLDHDLDLHELPSSRRDSRKSWTVKAKRMHRVVEQVDEEPIGIVIFKWCLIFIGSAMLGVVLFLTGEVIYAWSSGQLRQEKELALANFKNQLMEASTNDSTDP